MAKRFDSVLQRRFPGSCMTNNPSRSRPLLLSSVVILMGLLQPSVSHAQTPPDRSTTFDATPEEWRANIDSALLAWLGTGGAPDGYLRGSGPAGTNAWFFVSPASWAGDWSGYKVLKFDFSIPSRHYPDVDRAGLVAIVGANGQQMTWTGSTPLWTWTHYEISLTSATFGVDQAAFDGIMADVAEVRILAEFSVSTETVGLDNVLLTAMPPEAHQTDLISRFTDGTIQGWRPVDDTTLTSDSFGYPSFGLKADDWMDGRLYKVASPLAWAGDWRQYRQLSFDMRWTGAAASHSNVELVRIFGANGRTLSWSNSLSGGVWTRRTLSLQPETFGVSAPEFEAIFAHVSEMWIFGEFGGEDDITYLDNVTLSVNTTGPRRLTQNLLSRFESGDEGWVGYDNSTWSWVSTNGFSGGGLKSVDGGGGNARFQSPDTWAGDWRTFQTLRFMVRVQANHQADFDTVVQIVTWSGTNLSLTLPKAWPWWTPYTIDLTPETFGVSVGEFEAIMSDVACLWITADLVNGAGVGDTTFLDDVALLTESGAGLPPDRWSDFESGGQGWQMGGWNSSGQSWTFSGAAQHYASDGNPAGNLQNTDTANWTYWFTPETWAGDWRGLQSVSFDFKIIQGTTLFNTRMFSLGSAWTNLHASVVTLPVPGQWEHFEFALAPETFGVSAETFEQVMRDAMFLGIRSEWIEGAEREGLDNVRLTKATDAYWAWISGSYTGSDLTDETKAGRFADPDGDGADNWSEYIANTIPTNSLDRLRLELLSIANGVCTLGFQSAAGRLYDLERTTNPALQTSWSTITNNVPGAGSPMTLSDAVNTLPQFYRLKVRLAD